MPNIRPISDLRNSANEISDFCKQTREPVFITRNGTGDMVVQSMAEYERQQALIDLYSKLSVAEAEIADGAEGEDFLRVAGELRGWCMDVYKVKIYPAAKRDLQQIVDYLNTLSAQAALRYYDLLVEQISSLSHMPFRCPRPRDAALAAKGYRYLLVEKYLVFYVVVGDTVQIRRILYARRNYQSVLADPMS